MEKAHQDVFNVLLQVLEDGRLTDGQGRTVDFRNSVVIMTSNLGSETIQTLCGEERYEQMKSAVMEIVANHFRPEFVNRIDELVVFHPLNQRHLREITSIQIERLRERLAELHIELTISTSALDKLGRSGLRPGLWRQTPQKGHSAESGESAGPRNFERSLQRRRHYRGRLAGRTTGVQARRSESGLISLI